MNIIANTDTGNVVHLGNGSKVLGGDPLIVMYNSGKLTVQKVKRISVRPR